MIDSKVIKPLVAEGLVPTDSIALSKESIIQMIAQRLKTFYQQRKLGALLDLLYRLDISEHVYEQTLRMNADAAATTLAKAILERQVVRARHRNSCK